MRLKIDRYIFNEISSGSIKLGGTGNSRKYKYNAILKRNGDLWVYVALIAPDLKFSSISNFINEVSELVSSDTFHFVNMETFYSRVAINGYMRIPRNITKVELSLRNKVEDCKNAEKKLNEYMVANITKSLNVIVESYDY